METETSNGDRDIEGKGNLVIKKSIDLHFMFSRKKNSKLDEIGENKINYESLHRGF